MTMSMKLPANGKGAKEEHEGGGARNCIHGYICQLNLCALNFLRAFRSGYTFQLGSEDREVQDFDDMILKYEDQGRQVKLFLQSKHMQNCEHKALKASYLLSGKTDNKWKDKRFLLSKYYESYLKNGIESEEHYFIIYTNMDLDIQDLKKAGIKVILQSPETTSCFFQIKSDGHSDFYKLSVEENHSLFHKLYTLSDAYKMAYELVKSIKDEKSLGMTNDVLKKYKSFLGSKVLVSSTDGEKIRQFDDGFISCKKQSPNLKTFRNIFKKLYYEVIKPPYEFEHEDDFQKDLKAKRIIDSDSFLESEENMIELPDPSECIRRFFNEFVLAVNQPNETELEKIIIKEMEEIFNINDTALIVPRIKSKMLDWMKERKGKWLTKEDAELFIQEIKDNMNTLMIRGISLDYQNELNRMVCIIKPQELENDCVFKAVRDFLLDECETMLILSDQSLLSLQKVYQGIMCIKEHTDFKCLGKDDDLLFLPFGCMMSSRSVRNDLNNINNLNLLVSHVQQRDFLNRESFQECLKDLLNSVVSKSRKMILIFEEVVSDAIDSLARDIGYDERLFKNSKIISDKPLSFLQLDEMAQQHLLQLEVVCFQGNITNLSSLSLEIKNIIDAKTFQFLVQQESIDVGKSVQELHRNDLYIPRKLWNFDSNSSAKASNGASMPIFISEDDLLSNEFDKVLIISGEPRCGKSWLVSSLSKKLKMKYPSMWVLKLDLNIYSEICRKMATYTMLIEQFSYAEDADKTIEFIVEKMLQVRSDVMVTTRFEKELLKLGFRGELRLALLIEGFSELCKDGCRFALQLLKGLQKTKTEMLLITTRPEKNEELECLEGKYFLLEPLAPNENLKLVRLNPAIRLPHNLEKQYQSIVHEKLKKFLSDHMPNDIEGFLDERSGKDGKELWLEIQNKLVSGCESVLEREIRRATNGHYSSVFDVRSIINALLYIIKDRWDVTYHLE